AARPAVVEHRLEFTEQRRFRTRRLGTQVEAPPQNLDELLARQRRIVQIDTAHMTTGFRLERGLEQRRFSSSCFADKNGHSLCRRQAILKVAQRLPVTGSEEQIFWVRSQLERELAKSVITLVHRPVQPTTASS